MPISRSAQTEHERWLRDAVYRMDGVDGLERIARRTRRPQACLAWCAALADRRDWTAALKAATVSLTLVRQSRWRGDLLDAAALAAQELGRADLPKRLEAAWRGAPTLTRLLRWIAAGGRSASTRRAAAKAALTHCPESAGRQVGLLRVLVGDLPVAADVLSKAPGLGWSSGDHPGHLVFPLLAVLLANGTEKRVSEALLAELESTGRDVLAVFSNEVADERPKLATPSIAALVQHARPLITMADADRDIAITAMRIAAEKRVEGVLGHARRRYYGHAALLVASCLAFVPKRRPPRASSRGGAGAPACLAGGPGGIGPAPPVSGWREAVVPSPTIDGAGAPGAVSACGHGGRVGRRPNRAWAELLERSFGFDVLACVQDQLEPVFELRLVEPAASRTRMMYLMVPMSAGYSACGNCDVMKTAIFF